MQIYLYVILVATTIGAITFVISGKCLTNGVDMSLLGLLDLVLFFSGVSKNNSETNALYSTMREGILICQNIEEKHM